MTTKIELISPTIDAKFLKTLFPKLEVTSGLSVLFSFDRTVDFTDLRELLKEINAVHEIPNLNLEHISVMKTKKDTLCVEFELYCTLELFNSILENALRGKTFIQETENYENFFTGYRQSYIQDVIPVYCDFLNIFLILNKLRNGCLIDYFTEMQVYETNMLPDNLFVSNRDNEFIELLQQELLQLSFEDKYSWLRMSYYFERQIWNSSIVTSDIIKNCSWYAEKIKQKSEEEVKEIFRKTGVFFSGGGFTYPEYTDYVDGNKWSVTVSFLVDDEPSDDILLCGGTYNKEKNQEDELQFPLYMTSIVENMIGFQFYNPDGKIVLIFDVKLNLY